MVSRKNKRFTDGNIQMLSVKTRVREIRYRNTYWAGRVPDFNRGIEIQSSDYRNLNLSKKQCAFESSYVQKL